MRCQSGFKIGVARVGVNQKTIGSRYKVNTQYMFKIGNDEIWSHDKDKKIKAYQYKQEVYKI